jgi:hypothetical protein
LDRQNFSLGQHATLPAPLFRIAVAALPVANGRWGTCVKNIEVFSSLMITGAITGMDMAGLRRD